MNVVVRTALDILMRNPDMPASEILQMAVERYPRERRDFASCDPATAGKPHPAYPNDLDPPSPFAELLRRAYAPDLDPRELLLIPAARRVLPAALEARIEAARLRWERDVIQRFDAEYRILGR